MHEKRRISFGKCRLGKGQVFDLFHTKGFPLGSLKIIAHFTLGWIPRSLFICSFIYMSHLLIACERLRFAHKYSSQAKSRVVGIQVTTRRNHVTFTLQTPISFSLVVICTKCFVYEIEIASIQHEFNTVALISSISDARHQHLYQNEWATITIPWLKQFYLPNLCFSFNGIPFLQLDRLIGANYFGTNELVRQTKHCFLWHYQIKLDRSRSNQFTPCSNIISISISISIPPTKQTNLNQYPFVVNWWFY